MFGIMVKASSSYGEAGNKWQARTPENCPNEKHRDVQNIRQWTYPCGHREYYRLCYCKGTSDMMATFLRGKGCGFLFMAKTQPRLKNKPYSLILSSACEGRATVEPRSCRQHQCSLEAAFIIRWAQPYRIDQDRQPCGEAGPVTPPRNNLPQSSAQPWSPRVRISAADASRTG